MTSTSALNCSDFNLLKLYVVFLSKDFEEYVCFFQVQNKELRYKFQISSALLSEISIIIFLSNYILVTFG